MCVGVELVMYGTGDVWTTRVLLMSDEGGEEGIYLPKELSFWKLPSDSV